MLFKFAHTHQKEIVKRYYNSIGLEVMDRECDFLVTKEEDARNSYFDSDADWLLTLDSDEILLKEDIDKLKDTIDKNEHSIFRCNIIDYVGVDKIIEKRTHTPVICVKNPVKYKLKYRFTDKRCLFDCDREMTTLDITLHHLGYLGNCQEKINTYMERKEFAEVAVVKRIVKAKGEYYKAPDIVNEIIVKIMG
jgi:hypothetical protein